MRILCPVPPMRPKYYSDEDHTHSVGVTDGKINFHYVCPGIMVVCPASGQRADVELA